MSPTGRRLIAILGAIAFVLAGCSRRIQQGEGWIGEREIINGVTHVRTIAGSVWNGPARLVEEASIGTADGADEYLLGQVRGIDVGGDRIYVIDSQVPVVRVYDMDGLHLLDIGREGDGPGEFRRPEALTVHPADGRLFVRDGGSGRINIYSPDGEPLERWMVRTGWNFGTPMTITTDGVLFTPALLNVGVAVEDWEIGLVGYGPEGASGDTIAQPHYDFREWRIIARSEGNGTSVNMVPFSPQIHWAVGGNGTSASGVSEDYRIDVQRTDGSRMTIIWDYEPVGVQRAEADWWERAETANMRGMQEGWAWNGPGIPATKPAYDRLQPDLNGRIWVRRVGPGIKLPGCAEDPFEDSGWYRNPCWRDEYVYDLFDVDGRYLGEVDAPDGFRLSPRPYIKDNLVIALVEDEEGVPYVKRFRLEAPGVGE